MIPKNSRAAKGGMALSGLGKAKASVLIGKDNRVASYAIEKVLHHVKVVTLYASP